MTCYERSADGCFTVMNERPVDLYGPGQAWVSHLERCRKCARAGRLGRPELRCETGEGLRIVYKVALKAHADAVHNALERLRKRSRNGN